jgi:hypothetical protein
MHEVKPGIRMDWRGFKLTPGQRAVIPSPQFCNVVYLRHPINLRTLYVPLLTTNYMLKKYAIILCITAAIILIVIATLYYPGGEQFNKNSVGFIWTKNYLSNLFNPQAVNGADNPGRPWAVAGVFFLALSNAIFFYRFSKKIPVKSASNVIKYAGVGAMVIAPFAVTSYHDMVINIAGTGALLSMFYITVFIFKSKLVGFKIYSVICLLVFYGNNYLYYTSTRLDLLPIAQKVCLLTILSWMICLEHFTTAKDFEGSGKKVMSVVK